MTQREFYASPSWRRCRSAFIKWRYAVDGGICQRCGKNPGRIVHHTVWLNDENCNDVNIALNFKKLLYECQDCHNKEKDPQKINGGRYTVQPDGSIAPLMSDENNESA